MTKIIEDFKKFALRGNIIDLAVGFTVGAAFTTVVKSLVSDILMPPLGLLTGKVDFANKYILLKAGPKAPPPYATLEGAKNAGAVTLDYGMFINNIIALMLVAIAMFLIIRVINRIDDKLEEEFGEKEKKCPGEPENRKCLFCRSTIPYRATRCPHCTSHLDPPAGLTVDAQGVAKDEHSDDCAEEKVGQSAPTSSDKAPIPAKKPTSTKKISPSDQKQK
jgi:large conductance mechanosensitive channel